MMSTYRSLYLYSEGTAHDRSRLDLSFLEGSLNQSPLANVAEAAGKVERELTNVIRGGGGFTRGINNAYVRPDRQAATALLIHASDVTGEVDDASIRQRAQQLNVADVVVVERSADGQWRPRWIAP
jgi:hypothetical protein